MARLVLVLLVPLAWGPLAIARPALGRWFDDLPRPAWAMERRLVVTGGLAAVTAEGVAVWMVADRIGWGLPIGLWTAHAALALAWWGLLLSRRRLSSTFTVACADLTALTMAVAAFAVFAPGTALPATVSLAWHLWMTATLFGLWQAEGAHP